MNLSACNTPKIKPGRRPAPPGQKPSVQDFPRARELTSGGFSLVEIMVALVIGMLGILIMMQTFSLFEGQKRTTSGGDDAISTGAISLYGLQRDIQQSGLGFTVERVIGCTVTNLIAGGAAFPLAPVTIYPWIGADIVTPPGFPRLPKPDDNTDMLLIVSGNGYGSVEGAPITSAAGGNITAKPATAFVRGDSVVAAPESRPTPCVLTRSFVNADPIVGGFVTGNPALPSVAPGFLFSLGRLPTVKAYAIRNKKLTFCDLVVPPPPPPAPPPPTDCLNNAADWSPIADNVVSLRAEYGRDTSDAIPVPPAKNRMDGVVDVWDQQMVDPATNPVSGNAAKNTVACALLRNVAVRLVLVARSSQPERTVDWPLLTVNVTPNPLGWMGAAPITLPNPDPAWPTWRDFRYKTFQTVVPLRNITAQGAVPEC